MVAEVKPPLQIINIGNGWEGYAPNLYIPAKSELTTTLVLLNLFLFLVSHTSVHTSGL